ncbi:MAG TPA: radical SAM protein [Bacillota bacterium]|nr:radical SAM protein [Bacillota bacterium]
MTNEYPFFSQYDSCTLCPRACHANRSVVGAAHSAPLGACQMSSELRIARYGLHMWEEPCLSGEKGSGTIFFTGCPLHCIFCQNAAISRANLPGRSYSVDELSDAMLSLEEQGALNINLVTGVHYVPHIIAALDCARAHGLKLPVIYNSGGYESINTLSMLDGYIDIYLPDMKFFSTKLSTTLAKVPDYFERAKEAIAVMYAQVGKQQFDKDGILQKGLIVRHLVLPGEIFDSKHILDYLCSTYGNDITISLMNQYTPMPDMEGRLARAVLPREYDTLVDYLANLGQTNAYTQENGTVSESFIPDFE